MKKLEIKDIINRANYLHNNKYIYDFTDYKNINSKIKIICPTHGEFYQRVFDHLCGHGCLLCGIEKNADKKRNKLNFLIDKANKIHNFSYDYSLLKDYKSMHDSVNIICPAHGQFSLSLHSHINKKRGCRLCALERSKDTKKDFVNKSNKIHNFFYNYDEVDYKNSKTKVIIKCPIHGDFNQRPMDHINSKQGCPICSESRGEKEIRRILRELDISFVSQKRFDDLKYRSFLYFDFYLPSYNTCIEFDGEQHFSSFDIFGGQKSFEIVKERDRIKNEYCDKNDINLLRITYQDKDIDNIIRNYILK